MVPGHDVSVRTAPLKHAPAFRTVRRMEPTSPDDLDERLESLPWEHVRPAEAPDRRWMMVAAGAVVVAAVTASATRTLWPDPPLAAPATPATTVTVASTGVTPSTMAVPSSSGAETSVLPSEPPMTEADLRAIAPDDAVRAVTAHAEWFMTEWLTIDGGGSDSAPDLLPDGMEVPIVEDSARSFVESATALSAEEIELGSWEVGVLVRSLSALGDGDYLRIPARVFLVTVGIGDDGPFVADLPSPGPIPAGRAPAMALVEESAPAQVSNAALGIMREAGLPDETTIRTSRLGDLWRVTGVVRDEAGVPFVVAVWLDESGEHVPAPG